MKEPMQNKKLGSQNLPLKKRIPVLILVAALISSTLPVNVSFASPAFSGKASKDIAPNTAAQIGITTLNLKQLGARNTIQLRGQDGRSFIDFNVPNNEVVSKATLTIAYKYSPDLLPEQSQINIYLNGEPLSTIEISKGQGNQELETEITIPPELFSVTNRFTFQLVGHYASDCEDPNSPKLWANISNQSTLKVISLPLNLPNELANFPIPFSSKNDSKNLVLPFIFMAKPDSTSLEAGGILSSWFGSISSKSGPQFPVSLSDIPRAGNAVIFTDSLTSIPGISLPSITGPMVFITSNPKDQYGKLLFVMGRDSNELKTASIALALGNQNLSGQSASLNPIEKQIARKPFDAPNWLSSKGPIKFSEINGSDRSESKSATENETNPSFNLLNIQMPPALFSANGKGILLNLDYSYTNQFDSRGSTLSVNYQNQAVKSITLPMQNEWIHKLGTSSEFLGQLLDSSKHNSLITKDSTIHIPLSAVYPSPYLVSKLISEGGSIEPILQMDFNIKKAEAKKGDCNQVENTSSINANINSNSTIDISGMQHFIQMPNLAAFSNSGFPFSRLVDLSETAVVLPDNPNTYDYSAYLAVLGRIGRLTGYPVTLVTVASVGQIGSVKDKDLLVITSGNESQPLLKQWESAILSSNHSIFKIPNNWNDVKGWFGGNEKFDIYQNAFITGFKSPLHSNHNVVLISSLNPEKLTDLTASLDGSMGPIFGSLMRLNEDQMELVSDQHNYHSGTLPWTVYLPWLISEYLVLFILLSAIAVAILSLLIYVALNARRRKRLQW
ncbi:MAG: cellulose biosynthesis cyclic di-GMP-binding regulatory protein BcsB [Polynucleobacter sp.]